MSADRARLVGRAEEVRAVERALAERGCLIGGAAGVGKSRLAREIAGDLGSVVEVLATAAAGSVPFGAVAHLLPIGTADPAGVIPAVIVKLREDHDGHGVVLVDDAHLLDDASAALVLAIATSGAARLLVTLRTGEPAPDAVTALWKERGLARVELQDLGGGDVAQLVAELLDGDVHPAAVERISSLTRGNPLYVVELVADARRTGALSLRDGTWRWREELLQFDRLAVLIGRRIAAVSDPAARGAQHLAVAGRLRFTELEELVGSAAVEELERAGLAAVRSTEGGVEVAPVHPLVVEVVAAKMLDTEAIARRRELAAAFVSRGEADEGAILRSARWLLDAGDDDPSLYVAAAGIALRRGDPALAERFAARADRDLAAGLVRSAALNSLARFEDADVALAPFVDAAAALDEATATMFLENWFRARLCGPFSDDDVDAVLDRASSWHSSASWSAFVTVLRAWVLQYSNRPEEAMALVEPWIGDETIDAYPRFHVASSSVYAQIRLGRTDTALEAAAATARAAAAMGAGPWLTRYATASFGPLPRIAAGLDLVEVEDELVVARAQAAAEGDMALDVVLAQGLGLLALRRGHARAAVDLLGYATVALARADPSLNELSALAALARAQGWSGDEDGAGRTIARFDDIAGRQPRVATRMRTEIEWARALAGGADAAEQGAALVDVALAARGQPVTRVEVLYDAFRFGATPRRVLELLDQIDVGDHGLVALLSDHVAAVADDDGEAQLGVASRFADRYLDLFAAEAAAGAARSFMRNGHDGGAAAAVVVRDEHAGRCGPVRSPALQIDLAVATALTSRELEVARLVAAGLSNQAIADALVLSVRTVETHVLRACRKLGVDRRGGLAELLFLQPPSGS